MIHWIFDLFKSGDEVIESATLELDDLPVLQVNRYNKSNNDVIVATPRATRHMALIDVDEYIRGRLE